MAALRLSTASSYWALNPWASHPHGFEHHPLLVPTEPLIPRGDQDLHHLRHHGHGRVLDTRHLRGSPGAWSSSPTGRKSDQEKKKKSNLKEKSNLKADLAGIQVKESREAYLWAWAGGMARAA